MKKILAMLLLAVMVFSLCACGDSGTETTAPKNETEATNPVTTAPEPTETEPESTGADYTIKVVDEGGNPVAGVKVQICDETGSCRLPKTTNEEGIAVYEDQVEASYKAQISGGEAGLPEGYTVDDVTAYYPMGENNEVTIVLKAIG